MKSSTQEDTGGGTPLSNSITSWAQTKGQLVSYFLKGVPPAGFAKLVELANSLDAEQRRAAEEGLSEDELALFDLLLKEKISKADREKLKQASGALLAALRELIGPMPKWTQNTSTQAEVKVFILDTLWQSLPRPPFSDDETEASADRVYDYVWQRSASGQALMAA